MKDSEKTGLNNLNMPLLSVALKALETLKTGQRKSRYKKGKLQKCGYRQMLGKNTGVTKLEIFYSSLKKTSVHNEFNKVSRKQKWTGRVAP